MTLSPIADQDDRLRLLRLITGHWIAQTVRAVAELSIAEHLADGPRRAEDIAAVEGSDPDATLRDRKSTRLNSSHSSPSRMPSSA